MAHLLRPTLVLALILVVLLGTANAAPKTTKSKLPSDAISATDEANNGDVSNSTDTAADLCDSKDSEVDCNQTEYSEYMKCVEKKRAIRKKRQTICPYSSIDNRATDSHIDVKESNMDYSALSECQFTRNKCVVGCQGDATCVLGCQTCDESTGDVAGIVCPGEYHHCIANCMPGQSCETTCENLCSRKFRPLGYKTVIFQGHNGDQTETVQVPIGIGHNITTIIKLNNFINATNHINVPTNINNTNINQVHLYSNTTEDGAFGLGQTKDGSCCFAVQPKSCRTSTSGLRCHHRRHKTCGSQCTSRIIHAHTKSTCNNRGKCRSKVSYVPEPNPRCHYVAKWPYVSCGTSERKRNCNGCYDHYAAGYYEPHPSLRSRCMPCYDGGFDLGPRYRQGPVYRTNYYHEPPCYMTGNCYPGYGYGYYGMGSAPEPMYPPLHGMPGTEDGSVDEEYPGEDLYPGEEEFSGYEPTDETQFNETEWDQVVQKCKVINLDENTVIIKNCTESDLGGNPYAATLLSDDRDKEESLYMPSGHALRDGDASEEGPIMAPPPPPPNAYYQYMMAPYNYYNNYPPNMGYYAPPPLPPPMPYNYYAGGVPRPKSKRTRHEEYRPYYYDNYGTDDGDDFGGEDGDAENEISSDDFWRHDEEDLIEKGFEKVEEM